MKRQDVVYMNRDKDSNYYMGSELGMSEEALRRFAYTGYEVAITVEIDTETGECYAVAFEGSMLEKPVRMN